MRLKRKRNKRVEVPLEPDDDAQLLLLMAELEMSKQEVLRLGLTEEGRYRLQQAQERIKAFHPNQRIQEMADRDPGWKRAKRADKHLSTIFNRKSEAEEDRARRMLEAGVPLYNIEQATGFSRKDLIALDYDRIEREEQATRKALKEMSKRLDKPSGQGVDELTRRIHALHSDDPLLGVEEEEEYGPGDWRKPGLHTLGDLNRAFRY